MKQDLELTPVRETKGLMKQDLELTLALLTRTPATLNSLLRELPQAWTFSNEGGNTWNAYDVVGHFVNGERHNWMPRLRTILQFGESHAFTPFDRDARARESKGKSWVNHQNAFPRLRDESLTN